MNTTEINRPTTGEALFVAIMMLVMGFLAGWGLTNLYWKTVAVEANAAHWEMVNGGPNTQFKWGPKP